MPNEYFYEEDEEEGKEILSEWWKEFNNEELNQTVSAALEQNLTLKQSWWDVVEACLRAKIVNTRKWPEINANHSYFRTKSPGSGTDAVILDAGGTPIDLTPIFGTGGDIYTKEYIQTISLSYEVDLWKKIESLSRAACLEASATREDLEATALFLTGTVVDLWLSIQQQKQLIDLIHDQIAVSRDLLELVEIRFGMGDALALDVYQQKLQLEFTKEEIYPNQSLLDTFRNELQVLLARPPSGCLSLDEIDPIPLPPFPNLGTPTDLLCQRPDLRAFHRRITAADYEVGAAIADMFPQLTTPITHTLSAFEWKNLFDEAAWTILINFFTPLFDDGKRRAEVQRRKVILCNLITGWSQAFLDAMLEVENALAQERQQVKLVEQIEVELVISRENFEEARFSYINGLNDYLTVIAAIQTEQDLERRLVVEKTNLLKIRSRLYRALGGPYLTYWSCCL